MKIMYRVGYAKDSINPIEIKKETEHTVTIAANGRRENKVTDTAQWFNSYEDAYSYLCKAAESRIIQADRAVKAAQEYAEKIAKLAPSK